MKTPSVLGVIPARVKSTRLPGKILLDIHGKTLIQRVWEQACKTAIFNKVVIATDEEAVVELGKSFGAEVLMTGEHHTAGSFRVYEAYTILRDRGEKYDIVANVQGDMPFISSKVIEATVRSLIDAEDEFGMSTVARPITELEEFMRNSSVKVAVGEHSRALYFSRAPIPYARDGFEDKDITEGNPYGYKHIGLYVFRPNILGKLVEMPEANCERVEKLEQLRALANGVQIKVNIMGHAIIEPAIEVDTLEDLTRAIDYAKKNNL